MVLLLACASPTIVPDAPVEDTGCADVDADQDGATACDDCDEDDAFVFPGAAEACDGRDNDCSGAADEPWDEDGDGASACGGDCDDADARRSPALPEACDEIDNDCDGATDEGFDADGDGWLTCRGDCDDADATVHPALDEVCGDGLDNDCDPDTSEDGDLDGDGVSICEGDCDDTDDRAYPGRSEWCDDVDNDCDGNVDDEPECFDCVVSGDYHMCTVWTDFETAAGVCAAFGETLAVVDDAAENAVLADLSAAYTSSACWIGYHDLDEEGVWEWVDGSGATYTSWYSGEPNDSGGEDCAAINFGTWGGWNDYPCSYELPFLCE